MWNERYSDYQRRIREIEEVYGEERMTTSIKVNRNLWSDFGSRMHTIEKRFKEQRRKRIKIAVSRVTDALVYDFLDLDTKMYNQRPRIIQTRLVPDPIDEQITEQFESVLITAEKWASVKGILARTQQEESLRRLERTITDVKLEPEMKIRTKRCLSRLKVKLSTETEPISSEMTKAQALERRIGAQKQRLESRLEEYNNSTDDMPTDTLRLHKENIEVIEEMEIELEKIRNK